MLIPAKPVGATGEDNRVRLIPVARIQHVTAPERNSALARLVDLHGGQWEVNWTNTMKTCVNPVTHTLPAEKGTYLLIPDRVMDDEEIEIVARYAVIGWTIRSNGEIKPAIVCGMEFVGEADWAILHPNGTVELNDGGYYDNEKIWFENLRNGVLRPV